MQHFYGHLQAVLREIAPDGELDHLFARPEFTADGQAIPDEIEWSTALEGETVMFKNLSPEKQSEIAGQLGRGFERIKQYAENKHQRSGKERDYAEYLKSVAVSPDLNQVFMVQGRPVLVQWGFVSEDGSHPGQGIYAGWDDFIAEIHRKAGKKTVEEPQRIVLPPEPPPEPERLAEKEAVKTAAATVVAEAAPLKAGESPRKPEPSKAVPVVEEKEKRILPCGMGRYIWVKWLAILLAIIILLLLLLRFLPSPGSGLPQLPLGAGGGMGGIGGLEELLGGGGGAGGGGLPGGGPGNKGGQAPAPGSACPTCGHKTESQPSAPAPVAPGAAPSAAPTAAPAAAPAAESVKSGAN